MSHKTPACADIYTDGRRESRQGQHGCVFIGQAHGSDIGGSVHALGALAETSRVGCIRLSRPTHSAKRLTAQ